MTGTAAPMDSPLVAILWFIAIIAAIPLGLWLLKRSPMGRLAQGQGLRIVSTMALSGSQRVVIIEVGQAEERRWLVLGVTPAQVNLLHSMPPQAEPGPAAEAAATSFRAMLDNLRGRKDGDATR
jgi:flagellar protein FliO/FliZ